MKAPGFFCDPKTGRVMKAKDFIERERKEWKEAFRSVGKELFGFGSQQTKAAIKLTGDELKILMGAKRRR